MKLALLYAGQGSQCVGMGSDLYSAYPAFRAAFDLLPAKLRELCATGPMEELSLTQHTQPCMVAFAAGVTAVLREQGVVPEAAAGLSLGEYSALCAAGVFDTATAVALATYRGEQMAKAATDRPGRMAAITQLDRETLQRCCDDASAHGVVQIANYNCVGQMVIGGETAAVDAACEAALAAGARRVVPLAVSGAFHTPLMQSAGDALRGFFDTMQWGKPAFPVVHNCTACPRAATETIPALLVQQVQSSVYFEDTLRWLWDNGFDTVVEVGPGKTLAGFVRKTVKEMQVYSIEDAASLASTVAAIKEAR